MKISDFKNSIKDMRPTAEDEMKTFILSLSRDLNLDMGHVLPMNVLFHRTIRLNPKQRDALEPALNSLIEDGIFEERDGKAFLTEKGRNTLY
ncbi:hypothetical protein ACQKP8_26895 [Photobacterium alginatilyticum]|uniref:hypothetical protein n=1 Tax=Photobacterium TaxID=657 RepID=UPI004069882E